VRATIRAFGDGLRAPLFLLEGVHATPAWSRYWRVVFRQLLATVAILSLAVPSLLSGLDLAARERHTNIQIHGTNIVVVRKPTKLEVRTAKEGEPDGGRTDEGPIKVAGSSFVAAHAPALLSLWIALVSIYGTWLFLELLVGWVSYEYVDDVSDGMAVALALPVRASERDRPPRLRFNMRKLLGRLWRQLAGAIVLASGAPIFLVARLVPRVGTSLQTAVIIAWGMYWLLVTTAAKSELAWRETPRRPPWFLRGWTQLTTRVPGFRWTLPRAYGRLWFRITRKLHGAALLVEEAPVAMLGLSVVRVAANLPVLGLLLRPVLPVAATLLVTRARQIVRPPETT
jgi:hypothetical protein